MSAWIVIGSISGLISVAMGAFGAHALSETLDPKMLSVYHTAAQYEMYHALALVALGIWVAQHSAAPWISISGWSFTIGSILFSGSLYLLAITGIRWLGAITPAGGLLFMVGWATFAVSALKR